MFIDKIFQITYKKKINSVGDFVGLYKIYKILFFRITHKIAPFYGNNNKIYIVENEIKKEVNISFFNKKSIKTRNLKLTICGDNNTLILPPIEQMTKCAIFIEGNNNEVTLNSPAKYRWLTIDVNKNCQNGKVVFGKNFECQRTNIYCIGSDISVSFGDNCMISHDIRIDTTDWHPIFDLKTKKRINYEKSVHIGNNVWIGKNVTILKGTSIPNHCIIGSNSVVTKEFSEENSIIAGNPAKVKKTGIYWEH